MLCPCCGYPGENRRFCTECGTALYSTPVEPESVAIGANRQTVISNRQRQVAGALIGRMLGQKYYLESKIGDGGMGTVYRARRMANGDRAAVKVLHTDQVTDLQAVERFRREAQTAARLKHPNVVKVYDFGISNEGLIYLVMELVEGETLRQIIEREGVLGEVTVAEVIRQVCSALDEAHQAGVVHRDIKPENILVQATIGGLSVKVLDFGIAALRGGTSSDKLTRKGDIVGTPHYMSPEHCLGEELDGRSDIYSLGVVLYEMLTAFVPFDSPTSSAIFVQQVTQSPPPLREQNPNVSPEVEAVVLKALEKRRELRQQTACELSMELVAAVSGQQDGLHSRVTEILPEAFILPIDKVPPPLQSIEPVATGYEDLVLEDEPVFTEELVDTGLLNKLRLLLLTLMGLLAVTLGVWLYLRSSERERVVVDNDSASNAAPSPTASVQPVAASQNTGAANIPPPQPGPSNLWEVIADQTTGVTNAENALGEQDRKLAVIKPGGQLALDYRESQFFSDGRGPDLRIYAPNQKDVSYTISLREDQAGDWKRVDRSRRWFPKGTNEHNVGRGVRLARQLMITNNGKADLRIDAIVPLYKSESSSQSIPLVR